MIFHAGNINNVLTKLFDESIYDNNDFITNKELMKGYVEQFRNVVHDKYYDAFVTSYQ